MRSLTKLFKSFDVELNNQYYLYDFANESADTIQHAHKVNLIANPLLTESEEPVAVAEPSYKEKDLMEQANDDAQKIILNAQYFSQKIKEFTIKKAKDECDKAEKEGYKKGYEAGKQAALFEARQQLQELTQLMNSIERQKQQIFAEYEEQVKKLALGIADKVIHQKVEADDSVFLDIYKAAVENLKAEGWVKVLISGAETEFATQNAQLLQSLVKGANHIEIVTLPDAPKGTCVVETAAGIVDAGVETQISRLQNVFGEAEHTA